MRNPVSSVRAKLLVRVAVVALISGGAAACSSDTTRFGEAPFSNPFSTASADRPAPRRQAEPAYTGTVRAAPTSRIERAPLAALPPAQSAPTGDYERRSSARMQSDGMSTGSLPPVSRPYVSRTASSSNWTTEGAPSVTLGQGESVHTLSQRYGVPASAIMQANNLQSADSVGPGSRLVIPTYSVASRASSAATVDAPQRTPSARSQAAAPAPLPAPTRMSSAQQRLPAPTSTGAVGQQPKMQLVPGPQAKNADKAPAPGQKVAAAAPALKPSVSAAPAFAGQPSKPSAAPAPSEKPQTASVKVDPAPEAAPSGPSFRWPVRGRVISSYGSKTNGSSNDGINVAVPEGTDVKASDDGVVAYAGSELKGFGNLVLIRHSNGWVTAYAHNSALEVKRGDTIRRGQIIAKSGSTGNVTSPQLHFEVRKGASTVDPLEHLAGV